MQCRILAVGSVKEPYFTAGVQEYLKRLRPVFPVTVQEVRDLPAPNNASAAQLEQLVAKEGEKLLAQLPANTAEALVVALAINGRQLSSPQLAAKMAEWSFGGHRELVFVIGGSYGLAPALLARADFQLSFGSATFPHQLMRLILCEQIYRAVKINRNEPYHK
ncbi:MAG: 23S rRNA (pseudouridine(1915)-N(3))-methyltransferase RlmH [Firmicutes bacterium]|nr:23S rRNA (pseudouridine(1915)-N(3))-methyltransferase RlmH [Bacillota bacterium]